MTDPKQAHDALFKKTFSVVEHAAAEFRAVLPAPLLALTDFSTLTLCAGSYVDEALAGSQSDLLFSVEVSGKPALLYVLFEHQSSADKLMPLRLLRYIVRILERHVDDAKTPSEALPLPMVIPVVLHHSEGSWTVARRVEELFDAELVKAAGAAELIPRLSFVLDDLSHLTDEELEGRALGLVPVLTLWALRDARSPERLAKSLGHWVRTMAELLHAPNGREALWTLFRYIGAVADDSMTETLTAVLEAAEPEVKDALMTIAEKWEAKGRAEGKAEGKAEALRKQLTQKFGALPEATTRRIASASEVELDRWLERVLTADTLDAVISR
ncbi:MAG TPA: Rpn family recombination-promoting nuclease/putative transposase [Polyangiaceae bacterium]|nr:Rpn family recombination-promoting nuclease/putative transposase [Polyangiaceae bacterium]